MNFMGNGEIPQGLKPSEFQASYAALKGRSFTMTRALLSSTMTCPLPITPVRGASAKVLLRLVVHYALGSGLFFCFGFSYG